MKYNYKQAIDALAKAYQLGDFEILESVRKEIYLDFGRDVAHSIDDAAFDKARTHKGDK